MALVSRSRLLAWTSSSRAARVGLALFLAGLLVVSAVHPANAGSNTWTQLGLAGREMTAVAVAPANPNTLLATDVAGTVYRSVDRGKTWSLLATLPSLGGHGAEPTKAGRLEFDSESASTVFAVANDWVTVLDPHSPSTLYCGTFVAVLRSYDGGKTWAGGYCPSNALEKSTDQGRSWKDVKLNAGEDAGIFGVAVKPTDSRFLVATEDDKRSLIAIHRSADGGATWQKGTLPSGPALPLRSGLVYNSDGSALFTGYTVNRSLDDGQTWQSVLAKQGVSFRVFASPTNPSEVFAVGSAGEGETPTLEGIYHSSDEGATFDRFPAPPHTTSVPSLALDHATPQTLFAATSDGVWAYTFGDDTVLAFTGSDDVTAQATLDTVAQPAQSDVATPSAGGQSSPWLVGLGGVLVVWVFGVIWLGRRRHR